MNWGLFIVLIIIVIVFIELPLFIGAFWVAPYAPTSTKDLERINKLAKLKKGQSFFDVGCGDLRICRYLAKKNPGVQVYGYEISYPLAIWNWIQILFLRQSNLFFKMKNLFKVDFSKVDVVYHFGTPPGMQKLKKKFAEMKKGSLVITYSSEIAGWTYIEKNHPVGYDYPLYVYEIGKSEVV